VGNEILGVYGGVRGLGSLLAGGFRFSSVQFGSVRFSRGVTPRP